jgi:hypothetical protein
MELLTLPGGLVLDDGRRLCEAELRPLTGHEEDWLASHPEAPSALAVTRLLGACLVRVADQPGGVDLARRLLVGDRDYLMLHLRRLTLGDTFVAVFGCPVCRAQMDVELPIGAIPVEHRVPASSFTLTLDGGGGLARTVRFRLPTGADQEAVLTFRDEHAVAALFNRCLLDDGGVPLSERERDTVIDAMDRLAPQVDLELDLVCPECQHAFLAPFDTTAFFFREMRAGGGVLLREVHYLALYYHWSEDVILRLSRTRRRAYLAMLNDTFRRE